MAAQYAVRYVKGAEAEEDLKKACEELAEKFYRLAHVKPVVVEGSATGWMLFFERSV